jgi:hypothetical protein
MTDLKQQHACIIFCFKLGKQCYKNFQNIESCYWTVENGKNTVSECFYKFKSGVTSTKNAKGSGHLSISKTDGNVDQVMEPVLENRRITICEAANMLGISLTSIQNIMKGNLNMHQIPINFVP